MLCDASMLSVQWLSSIGWIVHVDRAESLPSYVLSTTKSPLRS